MTTITYLDTFAPFGSLGGPGDPWVIGIGTDPADLAGHLGKDMLLIAEPWVPDDNTGTPDLDMFPPLGTLPEEWLDSVSERAMIWIAATRGRSTDNDDEPPAQYVPGRLTPVNFGSRLFDGVDPLTHGSFNVGVISLVDPDGVTNVLLGYTWDNTPLTIKRGPRNTPFKDWPVVARFRSAGLLRDMDSKTIQLRDLGWQLAGPLHGETYTGAGGVEGTTELTGRLKPWALGYNFNIEPILLSTSDQIFQWSLSSSAQLIEMRHGGTVFPIDADYPTYAALAAATIPGGKCATCLAKSLVRPNVTLQFGVRVDVLGDADTVNSHTTPSTRASIIRRIATSRGTSLLDEASEIDASALSRMEAYHSAPVGWFFDGQMTKQDAINKCLQGVLGWCVFTPSGQLRVGWLSDPDGLTASITVSIEGGVDDIGKPRLIATSPPRSGTRISFQWNYAPQPDPASLAGGLDPDDIRLFGQQTQYSPSLDPSLATIYPTAQLVTIDEAGFRDEADAAVEAQRQQTIFSVVRNRYERDLQIDPFVDILGTAVYIADDPLITPTNQICVGINTTGASSVSTFEFFA